jgi:hypothetical protein
LQDADVLAVTTTVIEQDSLGREQLIIDDSAQWARQPATLDCRAMPSNGCRIGHLQPLFGSSAGLVKTRTVGRLKSTKNSLAITGYADETQILETGASMLAIIDVDAGHH